MEKVSERALLSSMLELKLLYGLVNEELIETIEDLARVCLRLHRGLTRVHV